LLQELIQTYKSRNVPELITAKTVEFWGNTKRMSSESIDSYLDRFQELLEDLADAEEPISTKAAIRQFIFTLGPEFRTIQNNFWINNLPDEWKTQDWPTLLTLCWDFHNSVNSLSSAKCTIPPPKDTNFDREAHQKKAREWFMNPSKYHCELEAAQQKFSGQCIFHLSKTHATSACFVKKEYDKQLADGSNGQVAVPSATVPAGRLCHITEEQFKDATMDESVFDSEDNIANDTNDAVLAYFTHMSNHNLRLARAYPISTTTSRHPMKYPIIADSGANHHMFKEREFFETLTPTSGTVLLGDGKTRIDIKGVGTVKCFIDQHLVTLYNVCYIPSLGESVYSLFLHVNTPGHGLETTSDQGVFITFPDFKTRAVLGENDIYLNALPYSQDSITSSCPSDPLPVSSSPSPVTTTLQEQIHDETAKLDNILGTLQQYYNNVKTKRQLKMGVPAGFRQLTSTQRQFTPKLPTRNTEASTDLSTVHLNHLADDLQNLVESDDDTSITSNVITSSSHSDIISPSLNVSPIIRSVDKPSSSLASTITMSEDYIRSCVGFRKIDTMKQHFSTLYQSSVKLSTTPADAAIDEGAFATMKKKP
jgi:hypothetical protein